jgi:hypothetical protein
MTGRSWMWIAQWHSHAVGESRSQVQTHAMEDRGHFGADCSPQRWKLGRERQHECELFSEGRKRQSTPFIGFQNRTVMTYQSGLTAMQTCCAPAEQISLWRTFAENVGARG